MLPELEECDEDICFLSAGGGWCRREGSCPDHVVWETPAAAILDFADSVNFDRLLDDSLRAGVCTKAEY